ncbi:MAG: ArsR family transcriptional regulator [Pseudomonadales bacterium]|nr:ArsR family transcriptional regulator [Pseudomonadales bacterium]
MIGSRPSLAIGSDVSVSKPRVPSDSDDLAPRPADVLVTAAKAIADRLRVNVLRVLKEDSYGVLELCSILDIAQPALSHHLKVLHEAGMTARRREGTSVFYRRAPAASPLHAAMLAAVDAVDLTPAQRLQIERIHLERNLRSQAFFAQHAADFATQQARISETAVYLPSVLELIDRVLGSDGSDLAAGTALEIGPGEGELLAHLAARFAHVVAIDNEPAMLKRCASVVAELANVRLLNRDFTTLPSIARYRLVVAAMVLHHMASPARMFQHARRLVASGGMLLIVELCRHDREWVRDACGDLWLGFEPQELTDWAGRAGFQRGESQFLAQRNGFQIQIHCFRNSSH